MAEEKEVKEVEEVKERREMEVECGCRHRRSPAGKKKGRLGAIRSLASCA